MLEAVSDAKQSSASNFVAAPGEKRFELVSE